MHHTLDTNGPVAVRRLEVITGVGGRRPWTPETKAQIVAESFAPGAVVAEVARRHGLSPQQLHTWRRLARQGRLVLPAETPDFVPILAAVPETPLAASLASDARVEIEVAGAIVRVSGAVARTELMDIFTALRRSV